MELFYDERDDSAHEARGSKILYWLDDLGARPLHEAKSADRGFLFAGARSTEDYRELVESLPLVGDRPDERAPLLRLDSVLDALNAANVDVPTPKTWRLRQDDAIPTDLTYPLFLRTAYSSLKLGGRVSRVANATQLMEESAELRRTLSWDAVILAREWIELAHYTLSMIPSAAMAWRS